MFLKLVDTDNDLTMEFPLDYAQREALTVQLIRLSDERRRHDFGTRLAKHLMNSVSDLLDADLQEPTDAQLGYAIAISKQLGISLPSDALRYKGSMHDFLSRYADLYDSRLKALRQESKD